MTLTDNQFLILKTAVVNLVGRPIIRTEVVSISNSLHELLSTCRDGSGMNLLVSTTGEIRAALVDRDTCELLCQLLDIVKEIINEEDLPPHITTVRSLA